MLPKWHFLYGYVFSIVLVYFFDFSLFAGLVVFLSSVFIDLDHVLIYFLKTKNLNPWKFYSWSIERKEKFDLVSFEKRKDFKRPHYIFHGIEFLVLLVLLSSLNIFFYWILLGVSFHLVLDLVLFKKEHLY